MDILRLEPIFRDTVWGGEALKRFGYDKAGNKTGECWGISAHKNGDCIIAGGDFDGKTLSWCYKNHRELFGNRQEKEFPLLVKIIGAAQDLSIQVHPDDEYAIANENSSFGKTECWYILECDDNAMIVIGHNAKSREELKDMIRQERWNELIRTTHIKPGDFFYIEPGCLHAIKGGTLLIETQQSSDVTYRVYDYDRLSNGNKRPLHIRQSIDCISTPHKDYDIKPKCIINEKFQITRYVSCQYFTLEKWEVDGNCEFKQDKAFMNVTIIEGKGTLNGKEIKKGEHLILTSKAGECTIKGNVILMISYVD